MSNQIIRYRNALSDLWVKLLFSARASLRSAITSFKSFEAPTISAPEEPQLFLSRHFAKEPAYYLGREPQTKAWMVNNVGEDWVCIDAGAHLGTFSLLLGQLAKKGEVFAFEPTSTFDHLKSNILRNGLSNISAQRVGLSNESGVRRDTIFRRWGRRGQKRRWRFTTIDEFVNLSSVDRIDLIKIDVDRYDLEVLEGAKATIERYGPKVVVELNHALATRNRDASEAFQFMLERKYDRVTILDSENYLFERSWTLGKPWPQSLKLSIALSRPNFNAPVILGGKSKEISLTWRIHKSSSGDPSSGLDIGGSAWNYGASAQIPKFFPEEFGLSIRARSRAGTVGLFLTDAGLSTLLTEEVILREGDEKTVSFRLPRQDPLFLVLRKTNSGRAVAEVESVGFRRIVGEGDELGPLDSLTADELSDLISETPGASWGGAPLGSIETRDWVWLCKFLGLAANELVSSEETSPQRHLMERHDAHFLAEIYRGVQPRKHLEIGTWEGFGTSLCLKNCEAEIWTVNLPGGESAPEANGYSTSREPFHPDNPGVIAGKADSFNSVGWMYKSLGLSHRVHQVLDDSRNLRPESFAGIKFDTVLVDGSHQREVVASDINLAMHVVSETGIVILHDFSLYPAMVRAQHSCSGVIAAVADQIVTLSRGRRLVWLENSMLLLALPN